MDPERVVEPQTKVPPAPIRKVEELEKWLKDINRPFEGLKNKLGKDGLPLSKEDQIQETRKQVKDFIQISLDRKDNPEKFTGFENPPNKYRPQTDQTIASQAALMVTGYFRSPK